MGFTDVTSRTILEGWGEVPITLAAAVVVGDLIGVSSNTYVKAQAAATAVLPVGVAAQDGAIGDVIKMFRRARIRAAFVAVAGEIGDRIFMSDTAGQYSTSPGATPHDVGWISGISEIEVDPYFQAEGDTNGWLTLTGIGYMTAGTYGVPVLSVAAGETFLELWAKCTGAGHVYGQRLNIQVTNVAATSSQALRAELDLYPSTAGMPAGGSAGHFALELGANATGVSGLACGLNASIILSLATRSLQGTYCALSLQTQIAAGNTMPGTTSFIRMADAGSVKSPFLLDLSSLVTGATNAYVNGTHGGTTVGGVVRVNTPFGVGYIKLYSD